MTLALGLLGVMLAAAAPAQAQLPSICDEYPNLPQCVGDVGPGGGSGDNPNGAQPGAGNGPSALGDGTGGRLPFTGYPISALVLLGLLLLLLGLAVRATMAAGKRVRERYERHLSDRDPAPQG